MVEDEVSIRETLEDILTLAGYEVITADNGESGFFSVLRHHPDLILSDLMMPKMSGYELLEAVRSYPKFRFIPFIILSAKSQTYSIREGMQLGADDYIIKPFEQNDLLRSIAYRLEHQEELIELTKQAEKDRFKMDLHDNLQQTIVALRMQMERIINRKAEDGNVEMDELLGIRKGLETAFIQMRNLIDGSPSKNLMINGFNDTMERMVNSFRDHTGMKMTYKNTLKNDPALELSIQIIPVLSEILTNAIKHSKAKSMEVKLNNEEEHVVIEVSDDGRGFDKEKIRTSNGIRNIMERIKKVGGRMTLHTEPGQGTVYRLVF